MSAFLIHKRKVLVYTTKMNKNDDLMKIKDKQKVDGASILIYTEESLFKVVSLDLLKPQQGGRGAATAF